jgi:glycosyltransferase involved in cell wall biosynthesis
MNDKIKVSIIIASFNSEKTIEKTILSITNQTYKHIELIIIDGGSTDSTVDIIKKHQNKIDYWRSEKDAGISDAFNKGLRVATGDYINFQGADDYLLSNDVIEKIVDGINKEKDMLVCGRIKRISNDDENSTILKTSANFKKKSLLFRMSLPHQALFTNKKFFEKYGEFELDNQFCMDYELLLRAYKNFPSVTMKDIFVSAWREGGVGTDKTIEIYKEYLAIKERHDVAPSWILYCIYLWSVLKFKVKRTVNFK